MRGFGSAPPPGVDDILKLQRRVDRVYRIPSLSRANREPASNLVRYLHYYEHLYQAIGQVTGSTWIVDSSKDPSFGHVLVHSKSIDLSVIHLVRDSRAVAYSWTREKHDPGTGKTMARQHPLRSALEWDIAQWAASRLTRRTDRSVTLRYEDLVAEPGSTLRQVLSLVGEAAKTPPRGHRVRLGTGHAVSGNPMRFETGVVSIRNDDQWQTALRPSSRHLVTAATRPGLSTHGYLNE